MKSGLEIAQEADLRPITDIAAAAGLLPEELKPYGSTRAKVALSILERLADRPDGKLDHHDRDHPDESGRGQDHDLGLADARPRESSARTSCWPSRTLAWVPVFGIKGGGTGGGYAQVVPMEEINLHLNGDFHAVTAAHNLLSAALDASIFHGNTLGIDPADDHLAADAGRERPGAAQHRRRPRGQGPRRPARDGFVITAASEIMAILALAYDLRDLRARLGRIIVASTFDGQAVTAEDLQAAGAMTVIMSDAIEPNLVQTLEHQPVLAARRARSGTSRTRTTPSSRIASRSSSPTTSSPRRASRATSGSRSSATSSAASAGSRRARRAGHDGPRDEIARRDTLRRSRRPRTSTRCEAAWTT